jgi:glycerol-3-phosphate acyltransferase PlsY
MDTELLLALALGYLFGSIPFGLLLTRFSGGPDIRGIGSGNIGATNVLRTGRKGLAAATLIADMLKGTAAVLLMRQLFGAEAAIAAGLGAFLGHLFPVWLGFKGGKGVATFIGVLLGFSWIAVLITPRSGSASPRSPAIPRCRALSPARSRRPSCGR